MKVAADCPICGKRITVERENYQGWLFCRSCQCIFISREKLHETWPSLYEALKKKKAVPGGVPVH